MTVMLMSHAIRKNKVSLAKAQNTYKENVVAVNTLMIGVINSQIPTFNNPPPDLPDFIEAHTKAQQEV